MALHTAYFSMVQLTKLDSEDINTILKCKGFDLKYRYMTKATPEGVEFYQFLDKGSRLALQNEHIDFHALAHHIQGMGK